MNSAVIGIGSNIQPQHNVNAAKSHIAKHFSIDQESTFVTTEPRGFLEQPDFVNGAVLIHTADDLDTLKATLHTIEESLGRTRGENKFGPRTIDLDILVWNDNVIDKTVLERDFLKMSVIEVLPEINLK